MTRNSKINYYTLVIICTLIIISMLCSVTYSQEPTFQKLVCTSSYVIDGDTINCTSQSKWHRIRLIGMDAPEIMQTCKDKDGKEYRCGLTAKKALNDMIAGHIVECDLYGKDRYNRDLANCFVGNKNLAYSMMEEGYGVLYLYTQYEQKTYAHYKDAEDKAKSDKKKLWAGEFTLPSEYRQARRK